MTGEARFLAHGLGLELVEPDWPPLEEEEVRAVLSQLGLEGAGTASLEWRSPRPFSAAGIVRLSGLRLFLKRHHTAVRDAESLSAEHGFVGHLLTGGLAVPKPVAVMQSGDSLYEVQEVLAGVDLYRDALSWTPYRSSGHARSAGRALAMLHRGSAHYDALARPPAPLMASDALSTSEDLVAATSAFEAARPALSAYLQLRPFVADLTEHLVPWHRALLEVGITAEPLWTHNDWHPSNLIWSDDGTEAEVSGVIDFGLANRTSAVYDIATAIERAVVEWLQPETARPVHHDQLAAFLDGYQSVRELEPAELELLPRLLPVVHLEYALSEIEYFHSVVGSKANADLAYDGYLLGHAAWFAGGSGRAFLAFLCGLLGVNR